MNAQKLRFWSWFVARADLSLTLIFPSDSSCFQKRSDSIRPLNGLSKRLGRRICETLTRLLLGHWLVSSHKAATFTCVFSGMIDRGTVGQSTVCGGWLACSDQTQFHVTSLRHLAWVLPPLDRCIQAQNVCHVARYPSTFGRRLVALLEAYYPCTYAVSSIRLEPSQTWALPGHLQPLLRSSSCLYFLTHLKRGWTRLAPRLGPKTAERP